MAEPHDTQAFLIDRVMTTHGGFGPIQYDTQVQMGAAGVEHTHSSVVHGVSGLAIEAGADASAKIVFNTGDYGVFTGSALTDFIGTSAIHSGKAYELYLRAGWHGARFAIVDTQRNSTHFVFNSASGATEFTYAFANFQQVSGGHDGHPGHHPKHHQNAVSPRLRRLYELGYV